jgi:hypothetical protein
MLCQADRMVGTDGAEAYPKGKTKDKRRKTKVEETVYSQGSPPLEGQGVG